MAEWICILDHSKELKPLQIIEWAQTIDDTEYEIIIWRSESGKVTAMEPRCPHQWSHLGIEGLVVVEELMCVTHYWTFEQDGCGWKENEMGRRDKKADIATYPCKEENGSIFVQLGL